MTTTAHLTISLDGFVAGPDQTIDDPLGVGGENLHRWMFDPAEHPADVTARGQVLRAGAAYVMGRNMFGPVRGPWPDESWRGWWGDEPPYHAPVFVLTHHAREPIEMAGGTTFHFVTDGFDAAYAQALEAGGGDVDIAGGASTVRQALAAGVLDELTLDVSPILLGEGERIFDGVTDPGFTPVEVLSSPLATHIRYRIGAVTAP